MRMVGYETSRPGQHRNELTQDGLINQAILCGAGMHHHFSRVKRGKNARNTQCSDLCNSQERIDQSFPKLIS